MKMESKIKITGLKDMQEKILRLLEILTEANQIIEELKRQELTFKF